MCIRDSSELGRLGDSHDFIDIARHEDARAIPGIAIYRPNAPLFFANAESVLGAIAERAVASGEPVIVVSLEESADIDTTALDALAEFDAARQKFGQRVVLARTHDRLRDLLIAGGLGHLAHRSTYSVADAVAEAGAGWQDSPV